jgi:hypothetical protein
LSDDIADEFAAVDLGDVRREKRLCRVAGRLFAAPQASIAGACGGWEETQAAYRLLHGGKVTPAAILAPHQGLVLARAREQATVLVVQDTSEIDFTSMKTMEGRGPLNDEGRRGFFLHSLYVLSASGLPLGILEAKLWARADESFRQTQTRKQKPIEEKESYRWVEGYQRTQDLAQELPQCEVISVSDREGDIYEVFAAWAQAGEAGGPRAHWIIRGQQNRALEAMESEAPERLLSALGRAPELGTIEFEVKARQGRKKRAGTSVAVKRSARVVRQRLRALCITPRVPFRRGQKMAPVSFWAVLAEEIDPPAGEEPLCWLLLTSLEVTTPETAQRVVALYLRRWDIEVFHRVLKTGCRVEQIQLKEEQAVRNCLMLYLIIAWRLLYLLHLGRQCPQLPCGVVFAEAEWKAACMVAAAKKFTGYKKGPPWQEPKLGEFLALVARFGGHLGRRSDKPPGAQALWQGLARVRDFAFVWQAIHQS